MTTYEIIFEHALDDGERVLEIHTNKAKAYRNAARLFNSNKKHLTNATFSVESGKGWKKWICNDSKGYLFSCRVQPA